MQVLARQYPGGDLVTATQLWSRHGADARRAWAAAAAVVDPEIPVLTIDDLGILREVTVADDGVDVVVTPTYSGCPAMDAIRDDVVRALGDAGFGDGARAARALPRLDDRLDQRRGPRRARSDFGIAPPTGRRARPAGSRPHGREVPALPVARHPRDLALRVDVVQGAVRVPRLRRAVRLLQGALRMARARFHTLAVAEVRPLTAASVEVTFAVPEELRGEYDYLPGQHVALRATVDGRELRRSYSICRPPTPGSISVAIKRDLGGAFSTWATSELRPGDRIDVMSPQGTFTTDLGALDGRHIVGIAAGRGITPLMALAHEHPRRLRHLARSRWSTRTARPST